MSYYLDFTIEENLEEIEDLSEDRERRKAKHRRSRKGQRKAKEKILLSGHGSNLLKSLCGKKMGWQLGRYKMLVDYSDIKDKKKFVKYKNLRNSSKVLRKKETLKKIRTGEKQAIKKAFMEDDYDSLVGLLGADLVCRKY